MVSSILFLHVGQCGNQVGMEFWSLLTKQYAAQKSAPSRSTALPLSQFYDFKHEPNAILIDTEPKVIESLTKRAASRRPAMKFSHRLVEQSGCGNNWALGYKHSGTFTGRHVQKSMLNDPNLDDLSLVQRALQAVEKRIQMMDSLECIVISASLSGGTGSGVGSRLIQSLREVYGSDTCIFVCAVAAFMEGDTTLQYYNTMLSLAHFQTHADAVFLFQNSQIIKILNSRRSSAAQSISTKDINQYIASCLVQLFMPIKERSRRPSKNKDSLQSSSSHTEYRYFSAHDVLAHIAPLKPLNILEMYTSAVISKSSHKAHMTSWQYIAENFVKSVPQFDLLHRPVNQISMRAIIRGASSIPQSDRRLIQSIVERSLKRSRSWFHSPIHDTYHYEFGAHNKALSSHKLDNAITIVANRSSIMEYLNHVLTKVHLMLEAGAYVQHYERFGCSRELFQDCFDQLQFTIQQYAEYCAE